MDSSLHEEWTSPTGWRRSLRRVLIGVAGGLVLAAGVVMVVLPGPAVLVIPAGLGILAAEFPWAKSLLRRVRFRLRRVFRRRRR
ncbi:MAG: PGPGW domain-containing protein [Myxococcota bacterium]